MARVRSIKSRDVQGVYDELDGALSHYDNSTLMLIMCMYETGIVLVVTRPTVIEMPKLRQYLPLIA